MPILRITGPYAGHFIAALAHHTAQGWSGEARVFPFRPAAFGDPGAVADIVGSWVHAPSELDAVESAERVARDFIPQLVEEVALDGDDPWGPELDDGDLQGDDEPL